MKKILAIGCGGAGMFSLITASELRKGKFEITVLSDESNIYCRCTTPYILKGEATLEDAIQPESMVTGYGLNIVHEKAVKIDHEQQKVLTEAGNYFSYDYLVIATGSRPNKPPIPGIDGSHIYTVRTSEDIKRIQEESKHIQTAVVVGAGFIGIEMSSALKQCGVETHLVENTAGIAMSIAEKEFADEIISYLREKEIDLHFNTKVSAIGDDVSGRKKISLDYNGRREIIMADIVVVATGVVPNLDIIKGTDIEATKQGILVNEKMETNVKDIYACGDCTLPLSAITHEHVPSALASLSIQQSKIVGFQIAGFPIKYNGSVGAFAFQIFEKEYASVGLNEESARKHFRFVVVGRAETTDIYNDLKTKKPLKVKLIFAGPMMRLVGYEAFGNGVIASAEVASFAIGLRTNIIKMLRFNYISHPSLTPWPFMNPIIMATEDAMGTLLKNIKTFFHIKS